jgi:hypothetical protein
LSLFFFGFFADFFFPGGMFDTLKSHLSSLPSDSLFADLNPDQQKTLQILFTELQEDKKKLFKDQETMMTEVDQEYVHTLIDSLDFPPDPLIGGCVADRLDMALAIAKGRPNIFIDLRNVPEKVLGQELFGIFQIS